MNSNSMSTSATSTAPASADAISRRAYELWEQEGKPEGSDMRHWLQAEQELGSGSSGSSTRNGASSGQTSAASARNTGTDARPLQGTRAASAANRERKGSASPFDRAAPSGGQTVGTKRR